MNSNDGMVDRYSGNPSHDVDTRRMVDFHVSITLIDIAVTSFIFGVGSIDFTRFEDTTGTSRSRLSFGARVPQPQLILHFICHMKCVLFPWIYFGKPRNVGKHKGNTVVNRKLGLRFKKKVRALFGYCLTRYSCLYYSKT